MALRHTGTLKLEITLMKNCLGLDWTFSRPEHGSYMLATEVFGFNTL
jgi:hypothetical protein